MVFLVLVACGDSGDSVTAPVTVAGILGWLSSMLSMIDDIQKLP